MNKNLTEIVYILDRSGSMGGLEEDTIGGFNAMMEKQQKKYGWEFIFIGANIDAYGEAQRLGVRKERAVNYVHDSVGTAKLYAGVSQAVCGFMTIPDCVDERLPNDWADEINEDYNRRGNRKVGN